MRPAADIDGSDPPSGGSLFSPEIIAGFETWLHFFRDLWYGELPLRIHQRALSQGGTPDWHPEFARWMFADPPHREFYEGRPEEQRLRTTRSFRKLRRKAPREFDVLYLMVAKGMNVPDVVRALNERAERNKKPERYNEESVLVLAISGLHKCLSSW